jgi:hypothetical protein
MTRRAYTLDTKVNCHGEILTLGELLREGRAQPETVEGQYRLSMADGWGWRITKATYLSVLSLLPTSRIIETPAPAPLPLGDVQDECLHLFLNESELRVLRTYPDVEIANVEMAQNCGIWSDNIREVWYLRKEN